MQKRCNTCPLTMFLDALSYNEQLLHYCQIHCIIQFLKKNWFPIESCARKLSTNTPMEHELKRCMLLPLYFTIFPLFLVSYVDIACCSQIIHSSNAHWNLYIVSSATITITEEDKEILSTGHNKTEEHISTRYCNNRYRTLDMLTCYMSSLFLSAKQMSI